MYIEDANKQKLLYYFTPAAVMSNFVPLAVVLTNENAKALNFEYKMWNILTPVYNFQDQNLPAKALLRKLIKQIAQEYECEEHIYLCDTILTDETALFAQECKQNGLDVYHGKCLASQSD